MSKKFLIIFVLIIFILIFVVIKLLATKNDTKIINNFDECVSEGYLVLESYPEKCVAPNGTFVRDIGNEMEKIDLIKLEYPRPGVSISSPLQIKGEARGYWYFEANFPIRLFDSDGNEISVAIAEAKNDWMTTDFVPFEATMYFDVPNTEKGKIVFEKSNPSDLPENSDFLEIPIIFSK